MACVIQQKDAKQWFAELSVDMDKVWHPDAYTLYSSLRLLRSSIDFHF